MRLFLAISLPDAVRRHLLRVRNAVREMAGPGPSWVKDQNLHLTIKFLGETEDSRVPAICEALQAARASQPIKLSATAMECFPPRGSIRVIGAEMSGDTEALADLVEQIETICKPLGFPREGRPYRPHVTFARARMPQPAARRSEFDDATKDLWPGPAMAPNEFVLMLSKLDSRSAQYTPVARFSL